MALGTSLRLKRFVATTLGKNKRPRSVAFPSPVDSDRERRENLGEVCWWS